MIVNKKSSRRVALQPGKFRISCHTSGPSYIQGPDDADHIVLLRIVSMQLVLVRCRIGYPTKSYTLFPPDTIPLLQASH